ncbi:hypothetical protein EMCG_04748 [[Emmonsia] crescens]|uniref:Uncharacterized protein n=1 Tax=[Emmonsia] crescens TaxID=73230 RepID=A0A0G2J737_9EURO|nr:hypothetical protein EMCG_04748 [Emmonsia crescens UAMH 3008]
MRLFTWARKIYQPTIFWRFALSSLSFQLIFSIAHAHQSEGSHLGGQWMPEPPKLVDDPSKLADVRQLFERLPTSVQWGDETNMQDPNDLDPSDPLMPYLDILIIVDLLIPSKTIFHFLNFARRGILPNGKKTKIPIVPLEEVALMGTPYNEWALPPHNDITSAAGQLLMVRIGSEEDPGRLTLVEKPVHAMKARLWDGMAPISEHQWRQKGLNKAENFDYACQYIEDVIVVFDYLNVPLHISHMRETFNYIAQHLADFDEALNNVRSQEGKEPNVNMAGLWVEFIQAKYQVITDLAHSWVIAHVDALREPLLNEIKAQGPLLLDDNISPEQLILVEKLRKLAGLAAEADYTIYMSTDGYKGGSGPSPEELKGWQNPVLEKRRQTYVDSFSYIQKLPQFKDELLSDLLPIPAETAATTTENDLFKTIDRQIRIQNQQRRLARGEPEPGPRLPVEWISDIRTSMRELEDSGQPPVTELGYAIYRLSYGQNPADDSEWAALKGAIENDLASWGDGIDGVEDIKPFLKVKWFDGRELGLAEDDIDGAKSHFDTYLTTLAPSHGFDDHIILILDSASLASYSKPTTSDTDDTDDHYLLAVESEYDPAKGIMRPEESPGYTGSMRILTRLVWSELLALTFSSPQRLGDLWPLAMGHPEKVYVGQTVHELQRRWAAAKIAGDSALKARFEVECKKRQVEEMWSRNRREKEL